MDRKSHSKSAISFEASANKPKGVYFLSDFNQIYSPDTHAEIAHRVDMLESPLSEEIYQNTSQTWLGVEMIFSGWGLTVMNETFLSRFPDLKVVFHGAGSIKSHVTSAFWQSGIHITHAAAANAIPVAEYTCSQIILALKGAWQNARCIRKEGKFPCGFTSPGAYQTTVGLLSLGMIGQLVAEWCNRHDLKVIAYDPFFPPELAESLNITLLPLDEVFARADVVSCHTPSLPQTQRMIRGHHFGSLKPHAAFINTARGAVVAEDEMIEVLARRSDLMAILDVTHPEPPAEGSFLYTLDNVVLTPHIAGSMGRECWRMGQAMTEELSRYLEGLPLRYELTEEQTATMA